MNSFSIKPKDIRKFGIVAFLFFGTLAALGFWRQKYILADFFGLLSLLGCGFILFPGPLTPVYKGWLKIAHFIGQCLTIVILMLSYYLVITPAALILRLLGKRPLPIKPDPEIQSYWVARPEPTQPKERFIKRF